MAAIGIIEFVEIWGGCRALSYQGAWFSWCDAQMLCAAWRKCGWLGCVLAPEEIDRSAFVDREGTTAAPQQQARAPPTPLPSIDEALEAAMAIPDSVRAGTLAATQLQVKQLTEALKTREAAPFDAVAAGLLQPKVAAVKKRERDKTRIDESEGGDSHLRNLAAKARFKQATKETHTNEVTARREEREKKKAEVAAEREAQVAAYTKCHPRCKCRIKPCPMAEMHHCTVCGDVKKGVCRKAACQGDQPLLLTMREPQLALPAPTA